MLVAPQQRVLGGYSPRITLSIALLLALILVTGVWAATNHMAPQWDMHYYLDMATHGIAGNSELAAPFAYRPGAPILVGVISHLLHTDTELTFRVCTAGACLAFVLSCSYFAAMFGANIFAASFIAISLALNFWVVKWSLFSGTMVDIYAYPFLLAAFYALVRGRAYWCIGICAVGLLFKEFLLVPLAAQGMMLLLQARRSGIRATLKPLLLALAVLLVCFVLPRLTIHVARTFQDIDPINDGSTVRRLLTYPLSWRHHFNILFAYLAGWLPVLALLSRRRLSLALERLRPYRLPIILFLAFHFLLTMYGGTNIDIYIAYCAPVQIMVLVVLLQEGEVRIWEAGLTVLAVFYFNRIWMRVPLPENGMDVYLDFYGGYYMRVNASSFRRMGELLAYVAALGLLRSLSSRARRSRHATQTALSEISSEAV